MLYQMLKDLSISTNPPTLGRLDEIMTHYRLKSKFQMMNRTFPGGKIKDISLPSMFVFTIDLPTTLVIAFATVVAKILDEMIYQHGDYFRYTLCKQSYRGSFTGDRNYLNDLYMANQHEPE